MCIRDRLNAILILGEEIKSSKGDILGLFLQEEIKMKGYSPEEVIKEIHRQGGVAIIPHPCLLYTSKQDTFPA